MWIDRLATHKVTLFFRKFFLSIEPGAEIKKQEKINEVKER